MARIPVVAPESATEAQQTVLTAVTKKMGGVPNILGTMAQSPAVANAYLNFSGALAGGELPSRVREQIALVVGEANSCDYCVAAHTTLGKGAGLSVDETVAARQGTATDEKERAAVQFARKLVSDRGVVTDDHLESLRQVGYSDGDIAEIVANTALNLFTNYFNHVAGTEVDFPEPPSVAA